MVPRGEDPVAKWKKRIPLERCLAGKRNDHRSINGLKARISRISQSTDHLAELAALRNFQQLIQKADQIHIDMVKAIDPKLLEETLTTIMPHVQTYPKEYQEKLVEKRVEVLLDKKEYQSLVDILNPFLAEDFDPLHPTVAGTDDSLPQKIRTFERVVFKDLLLKKMYEVPDALETVLLVSNQCLSLFEGADLLEMDHKSVCTHGEFCSIWRCLVALGTDSLDDALEESDIA
eukprot:4787429-Amphidinium_carterae.3